ncbi:hypothetical protein Ancab_015857 [Ancistrocladus abbreviatus]
MSSISKFRQHLSIGFWPKPYLSSVIVSNSSVCNLVFRNCVQPARQEEVGGVEIDPRKLPAEYHPATFNLTSHRSPQTERVFRLVDEEPPVVGVKKPGAMAELVAMAAKAPTVEAQEEKMQEKTVFELKLESYDAPSIIKAIKEIWAFTELSCAWHGTGLTFTGLPVRLILEGKFLYCFFPLSDGSNGTSTMNFSSNAVVSGRDMVPAPLYTRNSNCFYYITVKGSVGNTTVRYNSTGDRSPVAC